MSPDDVPGMVMSSHSMLSRLESERSRDRQGVLAANGASAVSMGECAWSSTPAWPSRSLWRSWIREKASRSSLPLGRGAISVAEGKVPSRKASSWFSKLADKLLMGSRDMGGAIWTWGGGRDTTVFTGIVVMLAVTGLILEIGEGSSFMGREISPLSMRMSKRSSIC